MDGLDDTDAGVTGRAAPPPPPPPPAAADLAATDAEDDEVVAADDDPARLDRNGEMLDLCEERDEDIGCGRLSERAPRRRSGRGRVEACSRWWSHSGSGGECDY